MPQREPLPAAIARRRTLAIISHPDAGKTTLTEKLLLYGGAIQLAGSVRAGSRQRDATSDWMELEKQRGISVSSTVLQFEYDGHVVNLLDTPGHKDFSEDTYRVLTAVDSVIMVIDAAKGIEERTRKLFEICRMRGIPIFTFMNKLDRPAQDPLELLDELERVLGIHAYPVTWPLGSGQEFRGVFDRLEQRLHLYERTAHGQYRSPERVSDARDPALVEALGRRAHAQWIESLEMLDAAGASFSPGAVLAGEVTPVLFGSGMTNFGVRLLLDYVVRHGAPPLPRNSAGGPVDPASDVFSAFVFKVQANMNPRHRDRLVFIRVCSGRFVKDMTVADPESGKPVRLSHSQRMFGQDRESVDEAAPGDIVGLVTHKAFRIGATLSTDPSIAYNEIPRFPPEVFATLRNVGSGRYKQFRAGLDQLLEEGVVQCFITPESGQAHALLGAVGQLQFDVVLYRLQTEYGAEPALEPAPYKLVRWIDRAVSAEQLDALFPGTGVKRATDRDGHAVLLFPSEWACDYFVREHPSVRLHSTSPMA